MTTSVSTQFFGGGKARVWASGATVQQGEVVLSPADNYQPYVRKAATGSGATDPSADAANYAPIGGRAIKSIQRGAISLNTSTSATATVTAVNVNKSDLSLLGVSTLSDANGVTCIALTLTNSTTVTAARGLGTSAASVNWQLTEWY